MSHEFRNNGGRSLLARAILALIKAATRELVHFTAREGISPRARA
ncbi:hypothetical protein [Aliiruegeria lutimaris]|uniref:Uncharacterized protein n=1 Tax=Aliiruegeria lutimaris TaxID=571298 RepID=A0A1G8SL27_9RHOB|nr:hypothetical protein [Aliiruegeria lutimaris]SDJ29949.1 hypothetical protein SAMN04488026_101543 [Aliiruegeria lutimaris]